MKKKIIYLSILLLAFFLILLITTYPREDYVEIEGERISVQIAMSREERARGLMFKEELCENCGMLFVFEKEEAHSFWMKNTLIPLDIIFIDSDLKIFEVISAFPCEEEPCESYSPRGKALYVLEVNYGKFNESVIGKEVKILF